MGDAGPANDSGAVDFAADPLGDLDDRWPVGEAESNRLVGASLTSAILQNRYIEKLSDNIQVMLVPSSGGPLILDLANLLPGASPTP